MKHLTSHMLSIVALFAIAVICICCDANEYVNNYTPPANDPTPEPTEPFELAQPEQIIMYEANPRLYGKSSCLNNLRLHLGDIKAFGVNTLWLMPICECGLVKSIGSPYCIKNYTKVEPTYGTLDDLRALVNKAHSMGIAVIIDWVANHTSWDNPWLENKEWYSRDSAGNVIPPAGTNWTDVADLNFENSDMRRAMIDAMKYWVVEADIDGYRCDAADWVPADFWAEAIAELRTSFPDKELLMLAEGGEQSNFSAGFDMNYAWSYYDALESVFKGQSADKVFKTHAQEYASIPDGAVKLRFTTNHDKTAYNGTPIKIYGGREGSLAALAVTTYMGGATMLYGSQEAAQEAALSFMNYYDYNWQNDIAYTSAVRRLLSIRKDNDSLFAYGTIDDYSTVDAVMFRRLLDASEALVVVNVRNRVIEVALPTNYVGKMMTDTASKESYELPETMSLGAYEYRVLIK